MAIFVCVYLSAHVFVVAIIKKVICCKLFILVAREERLDDSVPVESKIAELKQDVNIQGLDESTMVNKTYPLNGISLLLRDLDSGMSILLIIASLAQKSKEGLGILRN